MEENARGECECVLFSSILPHNVTQETLGQKEFGVRNQSFFPWGSGAVGEVRQTVGQLGVDAAGLAPELGPGAAGHEEGTWVCLTICDVDPRFLPRG